MKATRTQKATARPKGDIGIAFWGEVKRREATGQDQHEAMAGIERENPSLWQRWTIQGAPGRDVYEKWARGLRARNLPRVAQQR